MTDFNQKGLYLIDNTIYLQNPNIECLLDFFKKYSCEKLFITHEANLKNLEFLYELPFLKALSIPEMKENIDLSPIYDLKNLQTLDWFDINNRLEVNRISQLEELSFTYSKNIILEGNKIVKEVYIRELPDFSKIPCMQSVEKLKVLGYKNISLEFINCSFPNLIDFTLVSAKKLESLKCLEFLELNTLELEKINKSCDLSILEKCKIIEALYLRIKIENCAFITNMPNLKIFFCNEVIDGNLEPIFKSNLEKVYISKIPKTAHYTKQDIQTKFGKW